MDKYLEVGASLNRLMEEYRKYGNLIVAVDFDDTLYDFHGTGGSYSMVQQLVIDLYAAGFHIIIWSGTEDRDHIINYLKGNNIPWSTINNNVKFNGKFLGGKDSRKVYANAFLDDRAGLLQTYLDLKEVVKTIKSEKA